MFQRLPPALIPPAQPDEAEPAKPVPGGKPDEKTAAAKERKSPLVLPLPHVSQMRYRITPPAGYTAGEPPKDQSKQCGPVTIVQHFRVLNDGAVEATFQMDTGPGTFTAAEVNALRKTLADLGGGNVTQWQIPIAFEHKGQKYLAEGRIKECWPSVAGFLSRRRIVRNTTGIMPRPCWWPAWARRPAKRPGGKSNWPRSPCQR